MPALTPFYDNPSRARDGSSGGPGSAGSADPPLPPSAFAHGYQQTRYPSKAAEAQGLLAASRPLPPAPGDAPFSSGPHTHTPTPSSFDPDVDSSHVGSSLSGGSTAALRPGARRRGSDGETVFSAGAASMSPTEVHVVGLREEVRDLRRVMQELQAERSRFDQLPQYEA